MLILIAHGSRKPDWRASVEKMVQTLQAELGEDRIQLAYLASSPPTFMDAVSCAIKSGATHIRLLPLFMADEGHVQRDIYPWIDQFRRTHQSIHLELLPSVGQHPLFLDLLRTVAVDEIE